MRATGHLGTPARRPADHRATIWDVALDEAAASMRVAQLLARILRDELGAVGVNRRQNSGPRAGQDAGHFHVHAVARYEDDTVLPGCVWWMSPWQAPQGGDTERLRVAETIRRGVAQRR